MKRNGIIIVLSVLLFFGLFAANLFAQDKPIVPEQPRVIVEEIVLQDPTVAQSKKWLIGLSGEYWYVGGPYNRYINDVKYSDGSISGGMPGGTVILGYDSFTLAYSYRKGDWTVNSDFPAYSGATSEMKQEQEEHEITARWLFKVSPHFNPYVIAGYNQTSKKATETLSGAWVWGYNLSKVSVKDRTYKSPLMGVGAIIPFNKYIGMRIDGRLLYSWADLKRDDGYTATDSGFGGAMVGTFYWNVWQGLNLQIGGKYQYLNGGDYIGSDAKFGAFGMIGYTLKF